ncbi:MAG TPA: hypothetical protein VGO92_09605, partial [Acidimicrobiales bacterium]|nr:hypothetical protein [Acidimicrobiales bacterium]
MGPELGRGEGLGLELPAPAPDGWPGFAEFLGRAYLRYSFTKGTQQEAAFLVDTLDLQPGMRVL